jgi:hypothetical protein
VGVSVIWKDPRIDQLVADVAALQGVVLGMQVVNADYGASFPAALSGIGTAPTYVIEAFGYRNDSAGTGEYHWFWGRAHVVAGAIVEQRTLHFEAQPSIQAPDFDGAAFSISGGDVEWAPSGSGGTGSKEWSVFTRQVTG